MSTSASAAAGSSKAGGANHDAPAGLPPSYQDAVHFSPKERSSIPVADRQSMEALSRPLPDGWIRQWDTQTGRHFYVDTRANGGQGRSTWVHPYHDDTYLATLGPEERKHILEENRRLATERHDDIEAETTDEEGSHSGHGHAHGHNHSHAHDGAQANKHGDASGPPRDAQGHVLGHDPRKPPPTGLKKLGRKMKDGLTHSTHEERSRKRHERAAAEQRAYEAHQRLRAAIVAAAQTGQPQLLGRDKDGKDVVVLPPPGRGPYGNAGPYGYDPWNVQAMQAQNPNVRYVCPQDPYYGRGYGYGYGGGYGLPLLGGLAGGLLLGGLFF